MIFDCEPIYDVNSKSRGIFEVSSHLGINSLNKRLRDWNGVIDRSKWNKNYPTRSSILIANRNIRKIEMLLRIRESSQPNEVKTKYGRIVFNGSLRHFILKKFNFKCADCGLTKEETSLHIDHIKPVSKGGTNELSNLQVLCKKCNLSKHTDEWEAGK